MHTWQSVSYPRPAASFSSSPFEPLPSIAALLRGFLTDARAGIRLCLALPTRRQVWPKPFPNLGLPLGIAETAILVLASQTLVSDCPERLLPNSYCQPFFRP